MCLFSKCMTSTNHSYTWPIVFIATWWYSYCHMTNYHPQVFICSFFKHHSKLSVYMLLFPQFKATLCKICGLQDSLDRDWRPITSLTSSCVPSCRYQRSFAFAQNCRKKADSLIFSSSVWSLWPHSHCIFMFESIIIFPTLMIFHFSTIKIITVILVITKSRRGCLIVS